MSIQDDYFDLSDSLKGAEKEAFERIWAWGVENENENEKLRPIVYSIKETISRIKALKKRRSKGFGSGESKMRTKTRDLDLLSIILNRL